MKMVAGPGRLARLSPRPDFVVQCIILLGIVCRCAGAAATFLADNSIDDGIDHPKWAPAAAAGTATAKQLAGRYIIEFDDAFKGSPMDFIQEVQREHVQFKWTVAHDLDASRSSIFRGISIQLQPEEGRDLSSSSGGTTTEALGQQHSTVMMSETQVMRSVMDKYAVKRVYPVVEVPRPTLHRHNTILANQLDVLSPNISGLPFAHSMTQVDRVRQELGITGKGVTVGIIDTGVDFYHPALGGGFGPGYKVALGYDLVGQNFNFTDPSSLAPSPEPLDICDDPPNGHGTHVAGIIGAQDATHNFTGVAPEATLGMWRIFGCSGSTSNDLVIKAMVMAYEAGCNIINLSLGGANSWPEDPSAIVADRIAKRNVTVVVAAGNEGTKGAFMISSPSTGYDVVSVASIDNAYSLHPLALTETGQKIPYSLSSTTDSFPNGTVVAYSNTVAVENDGCQGTVPYDTADYLKGKIVLVKRGTCTFDEKAEVLRQYGAAAMLIYDQAGDDAFMPTTELATLPTAAISYRDGLALLEAITSAKDQALEIEFDIALSPVPVKTAGMVSRFSSSGPTSEIGLKPDIAGIGGYVFSTLPRVQGGYGTLSGTSMAAPYVAGVCALYKQVHGVDVDSLYIREQLQNYAKMAKTPGGVNDNPVRQGAGLVQAYDSIKSILHLVPGKFSFNDTAHQEPQQLTLTNLEDKVATYVLRNQPAVALEPYNTALQGYTPLQPSGINPNISATLDFDLAVKGSIITLQPGESITVPFSIQSITSNVSESNDRPYPIFGGSVQVLDGESNVVVAQAPYIGVVGNVTELPIFGPGFPLLETISALRSMHAAVDIATSLDDDSDDDGEEEEDGNNKDRKEYGPTVFHLDRSSPQSEPLLMVTRLVTSTARLVVDVLNVTHDVVGTAFRADYVQRNTANQGEAFNVDIWNGTYLPAGVDDERKAVPLYNGDYFLRWRALKLLADPASPASWETVLSPKIVIS